MAYNKKETQVKLGLITKNERRGDYIKISRIIPEGNGEEQLDIRLMYTADEGKDAPRDDDGLSPTTKGVRINSEGIPELLVSIIHGLSEEEKIEFVDKLGLTREESDLITKLLFE